MSTLLRLGFTVLALPSITVIIVSLTNEILTFELSEQIGEILSNIDYVLGTRITNLIFIAISMVLVVQVVRRLFKFITGNLNKDDE